MTLADILYDIFALEDEMRSYERKYGILSETFYEAYSAGEEPSDDSWVKDWTAWAGAYQLRSRYCLQYFENRICNFKKKTVILKP